MTPPQKFETQNTSVKIVDGFIVHTYISDFRMGELNDALEIHKFLDANYKGLDLVTLLEFGHGSTIDSEVREFLALPSRVNYSRKVAFLVKNLSQQLIGDYFLKFNNPLLPAKVFYKLEDALDWLKI